MDKEREKLAELIVDAIRSYRCTVYRGRAQGKTLDIATHIADHLLANGVIVTPCVAMVEQFIKDGEFDRKRTAHNGKIAVVYIDKSKWNSPLIDITEQFYNTEKAVERIQALKEREG